MFSFAAQGYNLYTIFSDNLPKSIWLEGVQFNFLVSANWALYIFINAGMLFFIIDALYRWCLYAILLWKLYYGNKYGPLGLDTRFLSPSTFNPSYVIGSFLFRLSLSFIFIALNYFTYIYFYTGVNLSTISNLSAVVVLLVQYSYGLVFIPFLIFFIPVVPVRLAHKKILLEIEKIGFDIYLSILKNTSADKEKHYSNFISHLENTEKFSKASIWPVKLSIVKLIYTVYFIPILIDLIKRLVLGV